jgi:hypothetical protein
VVNFDEHLPDDDEFKELASELAELRRIGALNIVRASHIADINGDNEVAWLLVREASVMISVATKVEELIGVEPPENNDVNL